MAIWQECDRCGATTKDVGTEAWATCTLTVAKARAATVKRATSYDLCPRCHQELQVLLSSGRSLSPEQQTLLSQIWENAQKFDQSIGEVG